MADRISKPRLTLLCTVNHESPIEAAGQFGKPFTRWLSSPEQRWQRILNVGETWQRIEAGWIKKAALLVLVNEPDVWQVQPTPEQREASAAKIIEVGCYHLPVEVASPMAIKADWLIHPGQTLPGTPASLSSLWLRCQKGTARVTLTLIPE